MRDGALGNEAQAGLRALPQFGHPADGFGSSSSGVRRWNASARETRGSIGRQRRSPRVRRLNVARFPFTVYASQSNERVEFKRRGCRGLRGCSHRSWAIGIEIAVALKKAGISFVQLDADRLARRCSGIRSRCSSIRAPTGFRSPVAAAGSRSAEAEARGIPGLSPRVVQQFGLDVRAHERVIDAVRIEGGGFALRTSGIRGERCYRVEKVILAIGAMHSPRLLGIPGEGRRTSATTSAILTTTSVNAC